VTLVGLRALTTTLAKWLGAATSLVSISRLYASSAHMDSVLSFDLKETRIGSLMPKPPDKLEEPSAVALTDRKLYVLNMAGNRLSTIGR